MISFRHPLPSERLAALDLIARSFDFGRAADPRVRADILDDPDYAARCTIIGVDPGGAVVAHAAAKEQEVYLPGCRLPVARLGAVCVAAEQRRNGLGRALVEAVGELGRERAAIFLNPAPEPYVRAFYEALGFVAAVRSQPATWVSPSWPTGAAGIRFARAGDAATLDRVYTAHYAARLGSLTRSLDWWERRIAGRGLLWLDVEPAIWLAEDAGEVVAYLLVHPFNEPRAMEWACLPGHEAAATELLARLADGGRCAVKITPNDRLRPELEGLDPEDDAGPEAWVMVRAANLEALRPRLAALVEAGGGRLDEDAGDAVVITRVGRLRLGWSALLALAYDGRRLPELLAGGAAELRPDTAAARLTMSRVLPPRIAGRRPTDAY